MMAGTYYWLNIIYDNTIKFFIFGLSQLPNLRTINKKG